MRPSLPPAAAPLSLPAPATHHAAGTAQPARPVASTAGAAAGAGANAAAAATANDWQWNVTDAHHTFATHGACTCVPQPCGVEALVRSPLHFGYALRACTPTQMDAVKGALWQKCYALLDNAALPKSAQDWPLIATENNMDFAAENATVVRGRDVRFVDCMRRTVNTNPSANTSFAAAALRVSACIVLGVGAVVLTWRLLGQLLAWTQRLPWTAWQDEERDFGTQHNHLLSSDSASCTSESAAAGSGDDEADSESSLLTAPRRWGSTGRGYGAAVSQSAWVPQRPRGMHRRDDS